MKISFINTNKPEYVGLTGMLGFHIFPSCQYIEQKNSYSIQLGLAYYIVDLTWKKNEYNIWYFKERTF